MQRDKQLLKGPLEASPCLGLNFLGLGEILVIVPYEK